MVSTFDLQKNDIRNNGEQVIHDKYKSNSAGWHP